MFLIKKNQLKEAVQTSRKYNMLNVHIMPIKSCVWIWGFKSNGFEKKKLV